MNQQQLDIIRRGIALTIEQSSRNFRRLSGVVLVAVAAAFIGSVIGLDVWPGFPRWSVYALAVALVVLSLGHTAVVRCFEKAEWTAWTDFLKLVTPSEASPAPQTVKPPMPAPANGKPVLRVFHPDEEK